MKNKIILSFLIILTLFLTISCASADENATDVLATKFFSDVPGKLNTFYPDISNDIYFVPIDLYKYIAAYAGSTVGGKLLRKLAAQPVATILKPIKTIFNIKNKFDNMLNRAKSSLKSMVGKYSAY
mgnify:CR=1 FL=1